MKTLLLMGLWNPGDAYEMTRHNFGGRVVEAWGEGIAGNLVWKKDASGLAEVSRVMVSDELAVVLVRSMLFMNDSGKALRAVMDFYKLDASCVVVAHDDLELDFGVVAEQAGGSARGHNGVRSVIDQIGSDFERLRLGIGRPTTQMDVADFVLQKFTPHEEEQIADKMFSFVSSLQSLLLRVGS